MEKWSGERIKAHERYLKHDEDKAAYWERSLKEYELGVQRAKEQIQYFKKLAEETRQHLARQYELREGERVREEIDNKQQKGPA